jgi:hypothetical protein
LRDLDRAMGELSEEQRQVILLVGLESMSYEEVATILDLPVGTVRSRLSRGRQRLRELMGDPPATLSQADTEERELRPPAAVADDASLGHLRSIASGAA